MEIVFVSGYNNFSHNVEMIKHVQFTQTQLCKGTRDRDRLLVKCRKDNHSLGLLQFLFAHHNDHKFSTDRSRQTV